LNKKIVYIIYGVSGCGKSTVGKALAKQLATPFYDADDFHPQSNIKKMSQGIPLDDGDRNPWLLQLANQIRAWHETTGAVLACSALKNSYRDLLESVDSAYIRWVYLEGDYDLIANRLQKREDHFFDKALLASQFETLEKPFRGITISIVDSIEKIIQEIVTTLKTTKQQLGLVGLGVMGKSLAKNLLSRDIDIAVYNRQVKDKEVDIAKDFVSENSKSNVLGFDNISAFINSLSQPRTVILMVNAGKAVDMVIEEMVPHLDAGDCIVDGGNSYFKDTERRQLQLEKLDINFLGTGISGGEKGALEGPSIMPGGNKKGYEIAGKYLEIIAAKDNNGNPCCTYVGSGSSGHFIKMVHNGIEYAEMQLIAEIYHFLRFYVQKTPEAIANIFQTWRQQGKNSYLLEITSEILLKKEGSEYLIDKILDKAGQKGTGGWTVSAALDQGVAISNISEAVVARILSSKKTDRVEASRLYEVRDISEIANVDIKDIEKAYEIASVCNHHIGFDLIQRISESNKWGLNLSEIARIWTNGCIIRSELMEKLSKLFRDNNEQEILMFPEMVSNIKLHLTTLTNVVSSGLMAQCPLPVLSATANYILTYTSENTSANMIQAQRDFFGAHTYQRIDKPHTEYFHTNWKN